MLQEGVTELEQRKQILQVSLEQLERRQERVRKEMRTSFCWGFPRYGDSSSGF